MFAFTSDTLVWKGQANFFQLFSNEELLLDLRYLSTGDQEVRLNEQHFFFDRSGFWNPTYRVTEDGQEVMRVKHQFWGSRAFITFATINERLEMSYTNDPKFGLLISKGTERVIRYSFEPGLQKPLLGIELGSFMLDADHLLLLLALCFILTKDLMSEYGGANEELLILLAAAS